MTTRYFDQRPPRLYAHRGSSAHHPENTLPAFAAAVQAGLRYLELDVRATRDGAVVVHHDETLERLCGVEEKVADLPLDELRRLDAGFGFTQDEGETFPWRGKGIVVPTLEDVLQAFPDCFFNIEVKQGEPAIESAVLEVIRKTGREDAVLLAAERDDVMARLRPLCEGIPTSLCYGELERFFGWIGSGCAGEYVPPGEALQIPESYQEMVLVTPETIAAAHGVGMEMHVWTVNDVASMERLLKMGVDGVMSDYPERLVEVARRIAP